MIKGDGYETKVRGDTRILELALFITLITGAG